MNLVFLQSTSSNTPQFISIKGDKPLNTVSLEYLTIYGTLDNYFDV